MRVVAWNIRAGGGRRAGAIHDQLRAWDPDLILLSEFRATPPSTDLAAALAHDGWRFQRTTVGELAAAGNGLLVAARAPLRRVPLRSPRPHPARWLAVQLLDGPALSVGAMHVPNRISGRKGPFLDAVLAVAKRWRPGPALLAGDTNSGLPGLDEQAPAFDRREAAWMRALHDAGWHDAFRALHDQRREYTWFSPNAGNGFRLDQAFCNPALLPRLRAARHAWGGPAGAARHALSDHAALILDFD